MKQWMAIVFLYISNFAVAQGFKTAQYLSSISLSDLHGHSYNFAPLVESNRARCLVFLSPECPLCIKYASKLGDIESTFSKKGIQFLYIFPGTYYSVENIKHYVTKYNLAATALVDPEFVLTKALGATITPEVMVLSVSNEVVYSGKIDNWYEDFGKKRTVITEHYLMNVLEEIISGRPVSVPKTKPLGCYIFTR